MKFTAEEHPGFLKNLPKKPLSVGVILLNSQGHLLLVKPRYQETWSLPGGVVESEESPLEAALREVQEELGLRVRILRCGGVDYFRRRVAGTWIEGMQVIFWGAELSDDQIRKIRLQTEELEAVRFVAQEDLAQYLPGSVARRLKLLLQEPEHCLYLEQGRPIRDQIHPQSHPSKDS